MSEERNLRVVQECYAAFGRGDIPGIINALAADVEWVSTGPPDLPYAGEFRGSEEVGRFFSILDDAVTVERFEPREFIAQGDKVVVLGFERDTAKSTGHSFENPWAHVFTLRDGKIVRFQAYEDTAAQVAAFRPG